MTVRQSIMTAIVAALGDLAAEVELEPAGDPSELPALGIVDGGHVVVEREAELTRRQMTVTVDGFVDGEGGEVPTAARSELAAKVVNALLTDPALAALIELIDEDDLRLFTATLSSARRLGFAQDFVIQFTTSRIDPALPA